MAGDVFPIDVICHMPGFCEEKDLQYIFVPSKYDIGSAVGTKGPVQIATVLPNEDYQDLYDKVSSAISKAHENSNDVID